MKYLEKIGHNAEAIHYKPDYLSNHFNLWRISNNRFNKNVFIKLLYLVLKLPSRLKSLKRKKNFDIFSKKNIKSTLKLYRSNEDLKRNLPEADAYICGSDQIWNSFFENGKDPAFYLDFVPDYKLKISYAASFAIDELDENIKDFVKQKVSNLDFVSVREISGKKILNDLGFNNVSQVLDPVFLLKSEHWDSLITIKKESEKYIFVYDFDSNPFIQSMAENYKKKYGLKIITVNQLIKYADKNYFLEGPEKFLALVKNAEFVISNSFHAVAFSIIFKKDFVVFNRQDKINTRMRDLLASINLSQLLILDKDMSENHEINSINYNLAQEYLDTLINSSKQFLVKALKSHE